MQKKKKKKKRNVLASKLRPVKSFKGGKCYFTGEGYKWYHCYWRTELCITKILLSRFLYGKAHWVDTTWIDKVSPSPLPHVITDPSLAHRGIHVTPHTESMRFVRHRKNRTMLAQNVTCCIFGATCDRFVSPIIYVKLMYTLLREVESAVPNECFNGYKCFIFL